MVLLSPGDVTRSAYNKGWFVLPRVVTRENGRVDPERDKGAGWGTRLGQVQ